MVGICLGSVLYVIRMCSSNLRDGRRSNKVAEPGLGDSSIWQLSAKGMTQNWGYFASDIRDIPRERNRFATQNSAHFGANTVRADWGRRHADWHQRMFCRQHAGRKKEAAEASSLDGHRQGCGAPRFPRGFFFTAFCSHRPHGSVTMRSRSSRPKFPPRRLP